MQTSLVAVALLLLAHPALADPVRFEQHRRGTLREVQTGHIVISTVSREALTVLLTDTTLIHRNGREIEPRELKVGDRIVANVMPNSDGTLQAVAIEARPARRRASKK